MSDTSSSTNTADASTRHMKFREGLVVSNKMDKTVVVAITQKVRHPLYKKFIQRTKRCYAHDGANECQVGDQVRIFETRPLSKLKRWKVQQIMKKAV